MAKRRRFTPEFKAELVFEVLSGGSSQAEVVDDTISTKINSHSGSDTFLKMRPPCLRRLTSDPAMTRNVIAHLEARWGE